MKILIMVVSLLGLALFPQREGWCEPLPPSTTLSIHLSGEKTTWVEIRTMETPPGFPYAHSFQWGGDESRPPHTIITSIAVFEGDAKEPVPMAVPLSAYADLGTPNRATLVPLGSDGFLLKIDGGDASSGYHATLRFKDNHLIHRSVKLGEFPDVLHEDTRYTLNPIENN